MSRNTVRGAVAASIILDQRAQPKEVLALVNIIKGRHVLDMDSASEMIEAVHGYLVFKVLRQPMLKEVENRLLALLGDPDQKPTYSELISLVNLPEIYRDINLEQEIAVLTASSEFQGQAGGHISRSLVVLRSQYIPSYGFRVALAVDGEGNSYIFYPKFDMEQGSVVNIQARVKRHELDKFNNNVPTTYLHYVKFL